MWPNKVMTWYLTWTKLFYLKSFGHVAQSYWHTWEKKSDEIISNSNLILEPRNPTPKPPERQPQLVTPVGNSKAATPTGDTNFG